MKIEIPQTIGDYEFVRVIGNGTYSVICLVQSISTKEYHACKVVPRAALDAPGQLMYFERELRILQTIRHPNIVTLIDVQYTPAIIYVVMEYCQGGDILTAIQARGCLDDRQCRRYLRDILLGLDYLHSRNITHRDIKPENVLVDNDGVAKLADFGLSREITPDRLLSTPCGSIAYCAPELLDLKEYDGRRADLWSLGVLLYAMCAGRLPWTSYNQVEMAAQIRSCRFATPMLASGGAKRMISGLLTRDPESRPSIAELLQDPWLADLPKPRGLFESQSLSALQIPHAKSLGRPGQSSPFLLPKGKVIIRPQVEGTRRALTAGRSVVMWSKDTLGTVTG
jgi:serine/threonine protein kinase